MRKVTQQVTAAFIAGQRKTVGNTHTCGRSLYLHGNCIADRRDGSVVVRTCGWNTPTTKERLNGIPGVRVHTAKGQLFLNGEAWDGTDKEITLA